MSGFVSIPVVSFVDGGAWRTTSEGLSSVWGSTCSGPHRCGRSAMISRRRLVTMDEDTIASRACDVTDRR
jgi:hypothetical protein